MEAGWALSSIQLEGLDGVPTKADSGRGDLVPALQVTCDDLDLSFWVESMGIRLLNCSVVIVGDRHNPSILNPDFLERRGIVPESWNWEVKETLTTPPVSQVRYANGIAITCEPNKLQFIDASPNPDPSTTAVAEMAKRYVEDLPHVRYTAVGLNFAAVFPTGDPDSFLIDRFLKKDSCDLPDQEIRTAGLSFYYQLSEMRFRLSFESGTSSTSAAAAENEVEPVVVIGSNFHQEINHMDLSCSELTESIMRLVECWNRFGSATRAILGLRPGDESPKP